MGIEGLSNTHKIQQNNLCGEDYALSNI